MLYILLAILCSAAISVTMKVSDRLGQSGIAILCVNYIFASVFSLIAALRSGGSSSVNGAVIILGIITGILFLAAFLLNQESIIRNGAVLSATSMKMGIIVPIILARVLWQEKSSTIQTIGILLAIAAILIMTWQPKKEEGSTASALWLLPILLLVSGITDGMAKFYAVYGVAEANAWYMFLTFLTALIVCFPLMLLKKEKFNLPKLGLGAIVGLVNYASSWFLLLAVGIYPAYFIYPLVNVLIIAVISLVAMTVFGERLNRRQRGGMILVISAVILLNL